ncbi:MAG: hypothetical protein ACO1SX_00745 [Actinomycetota bacterium]
MTSEFGAAKSSDLYTAELPANVEIGEAPETLDLFVLDARIEAAQVELRCTTDELTELVTPRANETGGGVLGNLARFCDQVTEGIARFFSSLFGSSDLPANNRDIAVARIADRLQLEREHLQELQDLRSDLAEFRVRIRELQDSGPDLLLPHSQRLRDELSPIVDVLKEFAWTPADASATPTIDRFAHLDTLPARAGEVDESRTLVVGDPVGDAAYWRQQSGDMTCAIVDQEMILDKLAGNPGAADEFDLVQEAVSKGWARSDGATSPACVGYLLQERGVHTEVVSHESVNRLAERLASGQEAIVGVRGEILWGVEPVLESGSDLNPANHAIWVSGATVIERNGVTEVVSLHVNDSGDPNGRGREVPVEQFLRAWAASDNYVVYALPGKR